MKKMTAIAVLMLVGAGSVAGCTDNQGVNAGTGALVGAAVGNQVGSGSGRTAATLAGAAVGAQVGAMQPTTRTCTYRNSQGQTYRAAC
ncbi:glycine zipper 2TM domain-containing protein [Paracoccus yeei]|uniref:17 kDa surface antigen n=1 Tax=Paracoccus yeei TaxID=147645 RepID=A0A386USE3_9RHOB|nr:glycine zipper 2TM domain-containing protein [Paracoccus yeei]AYF03090.1 glycine zipper 2TM domain-containing protein [Paracoccus yeei]MBY0135282.1 glycine zipper 2TM domain-containing protein [Paracoccus yeei]QEU06830.1 glycine zipper 2TM domain-containing protein [Paracoccus yeei]